MDFCPWTGKRPWWARIQEKQRVFTCSRKKRWRGWDPRVRWEPWRGKLTFPCWLWDGVEHQQKCLCQSMYTCCIVLCLGEGGLKVFNVWQSSFIKQHGDDVVTSCLAAGEFSADAHCCRSAIEARGSGWHRVVWDWIVQSHSHLCCWWRLHPLCFFWGKFLGSFSDSRL